MSQSTLQVSGPWFEDFERGGEFDAPAVTLTAGHASLHQALFADRLRLPLDHATSAKVSGSAAPLCHPLLAINIAIGQSTWASQRVKANLFYRGLALRQPVFIGDTLYTRTRVVGLRQNKPQPGRAATGIVALEMQAGLDGFLAVEKYLLVHRGLFTADRRRGPQGWTLDVETAREVDRLFARLTAAIAGA